MIAEKSYNIYKTKDNLDSCTNTIDKSTEERETPFRVVLVNYLLTENGRVCVVGETRPAARAAPAISRRPRTGGTPF